MKVHHTFLAFIWSIAFTQINSSTPENADVSAGINSFANKLYEIIAKKNDNLIFSPFSAHSILALTSQGAGNKTTPVLQQVLGIPNANTTAATYKDILGILQTVTNVNIRVANKIYVKSGYKVQQNFQSVARNYFYADVDTVDFSQRQETVDNVNTWVKKQTDNRITELVSVNDFNDLTRALLISAVYFKGNWLRQFKTKHTVTDKFYTSESETVDCRMMKQFGKFYYAIDDELDAQVLEMKYQDERFSMIIVLPKTKTGIGKLEDRLIGKDISTITTFRKSVAVTLPRFKIESNLALKEPLQQIGLSDIFSDNADFSNMLIDETLKVDKVIQKAFVEVNEEGSEASAATGVFMMARVAHQLEPPVAFRADHPFVFYITAKLNGNSRNILFMGKIVVPNLN